jgi:predicted PurR-regulated permease PerM
VSEISKENPVENSESHGPLKSGSSEKTPLVGEIYKNAGDNISQRKNLQWNITNYTLALYAAIVALIKTVQDISCHEKVIFALILFLVLVLSILLLLESEKNIKKFRNRIDYIYKNFVKEPLRRELSVNDSVYVLRVMISIVSGGFAVSLYVILRNIQS